jgi:hypothetical protein
MASSGSKPLEDMHFTPHTFKNRNSHELSLDELKNTGDAFGHPEAHFGDLNNDIHPILRVN